MNIAIVLASGQGKRMGAGKNKTLLTLGRRPLIFHTINAFEKSALTDKIVVVCKKEEKKFFSGISKKYDFKKVLAYVEGGKERQDSAFNALMHLDEVLPKKEKSRAMALFHNGANPFVTKNEIEQSIKQAKKYDACVVAHPTKDTIKQADKRGFVKETLERKNLWNMQTPQTMKFSLALEAFSRAKKDSFVGTDDVSLAERLGKRVKIIEASPFNFKITTPLDLELAKIIIKKYV